MQTAGKYEEITNTFLASKHILASSTWAQKCIALVTWPYDYVIQLEHLVELLEDYIKY